MDAFVHLSTAQTLTGFPVGTQLRDCVASALCLPFRIHRRRRMDRGTNGSRQGQRTPS